MTNRPICGATQQYSDHTAVCNLPLENHPGMAGAWSHETGRNCCDQHRTGFMWTEIYDHTAWSTAHTRAQMEYIDQVFDERGEYQERIQQLEDRIRELERAG